VTLVNPSASRTQLHLQALLRLETWAEFQQRIMAHNAIDWWQKQIKAYVSTEDGHL